MNEDYQAIRDVLAHLPQERQYLLPALWAVVEKLGWLNPQRLDLVAEALGLPVAEVYGVASFYALLPTEPEQPIRVCDDIICRMSGSRELLTRLQEEGISAVAWACLGRCDEAPAALIGADAVGHATALKCRPSRKGAT